MDGQGRVSLEQFLAVVAMAEQDKGSRDAAFLHHLTHMKPSDSPFRPERQAQLYSGLPCSVHVPGTPKLSIFQAARRQPSQYFLGTTRVGVSGKSSV
eukprot:208997-Pelagomonas_calceolata.AAC.1